jgi:hypothetical protein
MLCDDLLPVPAVEVRVIIFLLDSIVDVLK